MSVRVLNGPDRSTLALTRETQPGSEEGAEIIDLVHLPIGSRPMPRAELDAEEVDAARALDCETYNECLSFVASAKWPGFHCRRCPKFARILAEEPRTRRLRLALDEAPERETVLAPVIRLR